MALQAIAWAFQVWEPGVEGVEGESVLFVKGGKDDVSMDGARLLPCTYPNLKMVCKMFVMFTNAP